MPPPMSPDERRAALIDATLPLLLEHGRGVTTRQIAEAAGVAEGTIFRVFDSKDEPGRWPRSARAFDPGPSSPTWPRSTASRPLRDRLLALTALLQARFRGIFTLMSAVGDGRAARRCTDRAHATRAGAAASEIMVELVGARRRPDQLLARGARARCCGCSPSPAATPTSPTATMLTPEQIVDLAARRAS